MALAGLIKKEFPSVDGKSSATVETHLLEVFKTLISRNTSDAQAAFEVVSRFIKSDPSAPFDAGSPKDLDAAVAKAFAVRKEPADDEGTAKALVGVPDVQAGLELTKWAGFGFSAAEAHAISCSFMHLASKEGVNQVRFWGKILGSKADYYVAEGKFGGDAEATDGVEPAGEIGVNFYTYWVTTSLHATEADWYQLPLATAEQIVASRKVKKILTGDLKAPVITHPYFAGNEEHLLRAMIADISATTILAPAGKFQRAAEAEDLRATEEDAENPFKVPALKTLASSSAWVHARENILKSGKTTPAVAPEEGAAEDEEGMSILTRKYQEEVKNDPFVPPLLPISSDEAPEGSMPCWSISTVYDKTERVIPLPVVEDGPTSETISYGVVAVKSNVWPGAVTVCRGQEFVNFYAGYGHKIGIYYPVEPPPVMDEPADVEEAPEPTGEETPAPEMEAG
jgi:radial spoke head protein 4A